MPKPARTVRPRPCHCDDVMEWLIRYDRLPPRCRPSEPALSQVVASIILALLGLGLCRLITG